MRIYKSFLLTAVVLFAPIVAQAHAFLDHALPKVGSQVSTSPTEVKIWFTEEIEPAFSTLVVQDSSGTQVDKKDAHVDPDNHALFIVSVPTLAPGTYKVLWSVIAVDTHHTHGSFKFTVLGKN